MWRANDARWFSKGALAVALVGLAACADSPTAPLSRPSFDIWTQNPSGNPIKPWTGRSGSSAISAQAAFGVGGAATLTVTSYKVLDKNATPVTISSAPAGCISKIQVKAFGSDGRQVWVRNFNNLSPTPTWQYPITFVNGELVPGYRLHVQVNVGCNDPRRTDVVEVEGTVLADLADLVVPSVTGPAALEVGQAASISHTLANTGTVAVAAGSYVTDFYLSTDALITTADLRVGGAANTPALGVGETSSPLLDNVTVPAGTAAGTYYLGVIVDPANAVPELSEANNVGRAVAPVTVMVTDARVGPIQIPTSTGVGQETFISARVTVPLGFTAASGSCELWVGSSPAVLVAPSQGKTIAAGGWVDCEFVYTFGTENALTPVEIRFNGVSPADANLTNNVQSAVVNVTSLPTFKPTMTATWQLYDDQVNSHNFEMNANYLIQRAGQLYDTVGSRRGFVGTLRDTSYFSEDQVGNVQYALFNGAINSSVSFPLTVSVSQATSSASSTTVYHTIPATTLETTRDSSGTTCADIAYLSGVVTLNICSYGPTSAFPYGRTQIRYVRNATNAVSGEHWYRVDYRPATLAYTPEFPLGGCILTSTNRDDQCYTWLSTTPVALAPYLSTYEFVVDLTDARYHYSARVVVNLTSGTVNLSEPAACSYSLETDNYDGGLLRFKHCEGVQDIRNRTAGTSLNQTVLTVTPR